MSTSVRLQNFDVQPQYFAFARMEGTTTPNALQTALLFRKIKPHDRTAAREQPAAPLKRTPTRMRRDLPRLILTATLLSGTLDILSAFAFGGMAGRSPGDILRYVASGPFGDALRQGGAGSALLGLLVHFVLMSVMVSIFVLTATSRKAVARHWVAAGSVYGLVIYLVMYWVVVPARFGTHPATSLWSVGNALFSHIACVGLPMAWLTSHVLAEPPTTTFRSAATEHRAPLGETNVED